MSERTSIASADEAFAAAIMWCGPDSSSNPADKNGFLFRLTIGLRKIDADWHIVHEHHSVLLVRKPDVKSLPGVELVVGDLLDPVSIDKALQGVDKLYLLNAVTPDELTQGLIAYDLAKKRRLSHVVYHSVFRAEHFKDVPHFASKLAIESAIRQFDVPFTILRPNYFFQNDASFEHMLTQMSNGPAILSGPKVASIWSKVLGREIKYAGDNLDIFEEQMRQHAPSWAAFDIRMMFQGYLERGFVAEEGDAATLTKLLGHEARPYEDFARETMREWQKLANPRAAA